VPRIYFKTSDRAVAFPEGQDVNLLRFSIRHECGVPWKCASGKCGTDRVLVEEGAEHLSTPRRRERERLGELLEQGYRLCCQTYATGDVTISWDPDQRGLDDDSTAGRRLKAQWLGAPDSA
jgi:ferredoxin